ncbi:MAG: protoheme IX farnesyltransferase [SAR202 cluster bacterium]|nr:protoheme IX farnesyltransferase [SAR202 cluster bacterium]|tara:strand:+ start:6022 stop:7887 length:1866 start_codon:yes stop_codon:yes gene_type:complete
MNIKEQDPREYSGASPGTRFQGAVVVALVLTFFLIGLGAFVRTTESGLGCPDWPLCHGQIIPPFEFHTLVEYSHRLTASLVITLVGLLTVIVWLRYRQNRSLVIAFTMSLAFLFFQAGLGGVTVLLELPPFIVAVHLVTAQGIFASLLIGYVLTLQSPRRNLFFSGDPPGDANPHYLFKRALIATHAAYLITVSGAYVVAAAATGSCPDWPLCNGLSVFGSALQTNIHMAHRILALLLGVTIVWGVLPSWRARNHNRALGLIALAVLIALGIQILVGALNPWLNFVIPIRVLHLSMATVVGGSLVVLTSILFIAKSSSLFAASSESPENDETQRGLGIIVDYIVLMKPWIVVLLLVTALGGAILAAEGIPQWKILIAVLLGGTLAAGGSSALNHFMDQDIDQLMKRTRLRPVANKRISPRNALVFGLILNALAFVLLWSWANLLAAFLAMGGSVFYVLVYTGWLKRSTTQNIVIGGAAGAIPPLVGWAAVTDGLALPALFLFAIIFYWTPPHFWALALLIQKDYAEAKVPMLPVVEGEASTRWAILLYVLLLTAITMLFYVTTPSLSVLYLVSAAILGGLFSLYAVRLVRKAAREQAVQLYKYSLYYLAILFLVIMVDGTI